MIPFHGCQFSGHGGHYESWFLRANEPGGSRAFWIRYTLFVPADGKRPTLGELWAIWFDGEGDNIVAVKQECPLSDCSFDRDTMDVSIGAAHLQSGALNGSAELGGHRIAWTLRYSGESDTLLFLPEKLYRGGFPKAKSLVSRPLVTFDGEIHVDGTTYAIEQWRGSENHNWGSKHTDQYAWGQVAGFDDAPDALLECITARVKLGPVKTPWLTIACLRLGDETYAFNSIPTALRASGHYDFFSWHFSTSSGGNRLSARIEAPARHFAALTYYNPPKGSKTCLNSKIGRCELTLERPGQPALKLHSKHGAAFEILTDRSDHGRPIAVPGSFG